MNIRKRGLIAVIAALLCFFNTSSVAQDVALDELKQSIRDVLIEYNVPAVSIAMLDKNEPVWVGALGKSNVERNTDANADTQFRIGSVSKMFVSLAILKLVEQGDLSLQDRVKELAPDVEFTNQWEASFPVRVVHLLEHTTGWDDIHPIETLYNAAPPFSLKEGLDFHPHSRNSRWVPGSRKSYANSGPAVAARIVENITAMDFEEYIKTQFFIPMGMSSTSYREPAHSEENAVTQYNNEKQPQRYWHMIMRPTGSINASAKDMAKFLAFYLSRGRVEGTQLISEKSLQRMEMTMSTTAAENGQTSGYGLSNDRSSHKQWVYRGHGGSLMNGRSELFYMPDESVGYFVAVNSANKEGFREIVKLIRNYQVRDLPKFEPMIDVYPTDLQGESIEGFYQPLNSRTQIDYFIYRFANIIELWFDDKYLVSEPIFGDSSDDFIPISSSQFVSPRTGEIRISRVVDPLVGDAIHIGSEVYKKISPTAVYSQFSIVIIWILTMLGSVIFFPVWFVRKLRGKINGRSEIVVRIWPLLAAVSVVILLVASELGKSGDPFLNFGRPSVYGVTIMLMTYTFFACSIIGVFSILKVKKSEINFFTYWFSIISSTVNSAIALYLLWFGIIGIRFWAY